MCLDVIVSLWIPSKVIECGAKASAVTGIAIWDSVKETALTHCSVQRDDRAKEEHGDFLVGPETVRQQLGLGAEA